MKLRFALTTAAAMAIAPFAGTPANANMAGMTQPAISLDQIESGLTQVQHRSRGHVHRAPAARVHRGPVHVHRGPSHVHRHGGHVHHRGHVHVNRGLYRGRHVYHGGPWVRPRNYWWPIGGAVAAGAALGMIASTSAAWAGPAPAPGYCWYYTDPSQRQGFWDRCP